MEKDKESGRFKAAFLGAIIGGILVAVVMVVILKLTGNLGGSKTETIAGQRVVVNDVNVDSQVEAVAQVVPQSVVGIVTTATETTMMGDMESTGVGSGFIVTTDGYIVTNHHVVTDNPKNIEVSLENGSTYTAQKIWADSTIDLAVIKIEAEGLPVVALGDSDTLKVGEVAVAIGNPLGLQFERTVTAGIISALNRSLMVDSNLVAEDLIQTDATINQGNSGGPLVDGSGEVIGINTYKNAQGEGMGFAIPINIAKPIITEIIATGKFVPTLIGVTGYDKQQAAYLMDSVDFDKGIYLYSVQEGSGAANAGLKEGDILLTAKGTEVNTMLKLKEILYGLNGGDSLDITYTRGGSVQNASVVVQDGN